MSARKRFRPAPTVEQIQTDVLTRVRIWWITSYVAHEKHVSILVPSLDWLCDCDLSFYEYMEVVVVVVVEKLFCFELSN